MGRRTKIVATMGPACQDSPSLMRLIKAGINVARLNLSHGSHAEHTQVYKNLRSASVEQGKPICIIMDLQGPKIRIGKLPDEGIQLVPGQSITLTAQSGLISAGEIPVDFSELTANVHPGGRILLDDGNLELKVKSVDLGSVKTNVVIGGILKSHKGISLPDAHLDISALTAKDIDDLEFGLKLGVDAVALSFVRSEADVMQLREQIKAIDSQMEHIPIIAKLERRQALDHLDAIISIADGVMVARGDLGVEMSPQEVPIAQKRIIECANRHAKVVITATQMLESMIHNPRPTRAEASDVANAIFDGTDSVMLSGETAIGEYPIQSVEMMSAIICQAEAHVEEWGHWHGLRRDDSERDDSIFMAMAVSELAHDRNVAAIAVFTMSGRTARYVSKTRPQVPILAFTPDRHTYLRIEMYWGVTPFLVPQLDTLEDLLINVDKALNASGIVKKGQQVALTCGFPVASISPTNLIMLHTING